MTRPPVKLQPAQLIALLQAMAVGDVNIVQTYKSDNRSTVLCVEYEGSRLAVKRYHQGLLGPVEYMLGLSPAHREQRGAMTLVNLGFRVNRPLTVARCPKTGDQVIFYEHIHCLSFHRWLRNYGDAHKREMLLTAAGMQAGRMLHAGYVNRDYKPSNLLIDAACASGEEPPIIIDTIAIRRLRRESQIVQMFTTFKRAADTRQLLSDDEWSILLKAAQEVYPPLPMRSILS